MKTKMLTLIIAVSLSALATTISQTAHTGVLTRISDETGVPVSTLQTEKAASGLGFGELETANLLANASGKSFDDLVAMHKAGEGWGEIAHDNGLNLGKIVSAAHRSAQATLHAHNAHTQTTHSRSSFGKAHMSTMKGIGHGTSVKSGQGSFHGMGGMGHGHGGR